MSVEHLTLPEWLKMHGEDPDPQANPWIWEERDSIELLGVLGVEVGEISRQVTAGSQNPIE